MFNDDDNTSEVGQVMQPGIVVQHEPGTGHPGKAGQGHCQVSQHHEGQSMVRTLPRLLLASDMMLSSGSEVRQSGMVTSWLLSR